MGGPHVKAQRQRANNKLKRVEGEALKIADVEPTAEVHAPHLRVRLGRVALAPSLSLPTPQSKSWPGAGKTLCTCEQPRDCTCRANNRDAAAQLKCTSKTKQCATKEPLLKADG